MTSTSSVTSVVMNENDQPLVITDLDFVLMTDTGQL